MRAAVPPLKSDHVNCAFAWSGSLSLPPRALFNVVFSGVLKLSSFASGGSFTDVTSICTVAPSHALEGSHTW